MLLQTVAPEVQGPLMYATRMPASFLLGPCLALLALWSGEARAASLHRFEPAGGVQSYVVTSTPEVLGHLEPSAWLLLDYARDALVLRDPSGKLRRRVVGEMSHAEVGAAFGVANLLQVGLAVPTVLLEGEGFTGEGLSQVALGDPRILTKLKLTPWNDGFLATLRGSATIPFSQLTPDPLALVGERLPTVTAGASLGVRLEEVRVGVDAGYLFRFPAAFAGQTVGHELSWGAGAEVPLWPGYLSLNADLHGRITALVVPEGQTQLPIEAALGLKGWIGPVQWAMGAGGGLAEGLGSPAMRGFFSLALHPEAQRDRERRREEAEAARALAALPPPLPGTDGKAPPPPPEPPPAPPAPPVAAPAPPPPVTDPALDPRDPNADSDGDGIVNYSDLCALEPEDDDDIDDEDGCPDLDNDKDGVRDDVDRCRTLPEDYDGWQDADGCPERDNDGDLVLDAADECPNDPETRNGFQDEDGCPDDVNRNAVTVQVKRGTIDFNHTVFFDAGNARLLPESHEVLDQIAKVIVAHQEIAGVAIEGHTDSTGSEERNHRLSRARALAVRDYLVLHGVEPRRLRISHLADQHPRHSNDTKEGRAKNRRVELHILREAPGEERDSAVLANDRAIRAEFLEGEPPKEKVQKKRTKKSGSKKKSKTTRRASSGGRRR